MGHVQFFEPVVLQIPLNGIHLGHRVADGCAGGKNDTTVAGQLIHIAALGEHV
ncbi:hypothetical protein SDC9_79985 [bioreactor metagenome]|uniref:Uncharacterized protein n=1 Tax=bioreactor metagenome TaxID=1076179 RepID=A0A644YXR1_9ZZZZ